MIEWVTFKALIDAWLIRGLIRFTPKDADGNYQSIWLNFEGMMFQVVGGLKAGTADLDDFEANYIPDPLSTWVEGKDVDREDIAFSFNVAAKHTINNPTGITTYNYEVETGIFLWGGTLLIEGVGVLVSGDQIQLQIVDIDGIFGPPNTVLRNMIVKKFVPGTQAITVNAPDDKPSFVYEGLFLRFIYTETNEVAKVADINLVSMR